MAQLYGPVINGGGSSAGHLPSISELPEADRVNLSLRELEVALSACAAGIGYPQNLEAVQNAPRQAEWHAGFKDALMGLHRLLMVELTVRDPRLGRAFCLGRSLSDTAWLPADLTTFTQLLNPYRVAELDGWLADLPDMLGHDAVTAVRGSLRTWCAWAANPFTGRRRLDWMRDGESVKLALRRQGAVWRDLLSGERDPASLLTAEAYIGATDIAVRRVGFLTRQVLVRLWYAVVPLLAMVAGLVYLSVAYTAGTAKFWGVFATVAGGSGVLVQGVRQSVSNLAQRSEVPLWQAERVGATRLPVGATSGRVRRRAVPREMKRPAAVKGLAVALEKAKSLWLDSVAIATPPSQWRSVWFKGGSEPGVLTLNYLATTRGGQTYLVSLLAQNPGASINETSAGLTLISAVKGAFQLAAY